MSRPNDPPRGPRETLPLERPRAGAAVASAGDADRFQPDAVLAGRYRVVRFIAAGGMGEVYEVEDAELSGRLALKVLRAGLADDERALERFRREILVARQVTHRNVCRIFDVGSHQPADGPRLWFLTMELLPGQTLAERLAQGPLPEQEALPLVQGMAAGLDAAHRLGISHRDFKSANILLVPEDGTGARRAVITDFGLACLAGQDDLKETGELVGTPAYLAPEQAEGAAVTPAADIYALGVVLFEIATGALPFLADTALATALKRLREPPPSPRSLRPDLDPRWEAAILRCLSLAPADRFATAQEVVAALSADRAPAPTPAPPRRRPSRYLLAGAALAVAFGLVTWAMHRSRPAPVPAAAPAETRDAAPRARRAMAVVGFKNASGEPGAAWLADGLAEIIGTELAGAELRLIPAETVARMRADTALPDADSLAPDTLRRVREYLAADLLVRGSFAARGGKIRLDVRAQDTHSGELVASVGDDGPEDQVFALATRVGARLREKLGASPAQPGAAPSLSASREAMQAYVEGLSRLRSFDALAATELLQKAVAADPAFALGHAALSEAWSARGEEQKAREEAQRARAGAAGLRREEALQVEARYAEMTGEWDRAVELRRSLVQFFPDNLDFGIRLAETQIEAHRLKDARATVASLRQQPVAGVDSVRLDLVDSRAAQEMSDFASGQKLAASASQKAAQLGARLLLAQGRLLEGWAAAQQGQLEEALKVSAEARAISESVNDVNSVARAIGNVAYVLLAQGHKAEAIQSLDQAVDLRLKAGNRTGAAKALNNLGATLMAKGELAECRRALERAIAIYRETGNKAELPAAENNLGVTLYQLGDAAGAKAAWQEALALARAASADDDLVISLISLSLALRSEGDLAHARALAEEGRAICVRTGDQGSEGQAAASLAAVAREESALALARKRQVEAIALFEKVSDGLDAATTRADLASVALEEGALEEAETLARRAAQELHDQNPDAEAHTLSLLAEILVARGKLAEADATAAKAREVGRQAIAADTPLAVQLSSARVLLGKHQPLLAEKGLAAVLEQSRKLGRVDLQLETRLTRGQAARAAGRADAAGELRVLEQEARKLGFVRIAERAAREAR